MKKRGNADERETLRGTENKGKRGDEITSGELEKIENKDRGKQIQKRKRGKRQKRMEREYTIIITLRRKSKR